ncbi:hypothetical protein MYCTH_2059795 [Thermothelomyces thermophilus ATCC 42464]|uniref:Cwf15/Cwc15 cell cycle control protein n=1 Tax=Thermothelomyces thermophilus (strain ATCC 42464 / BCRC 31852 / DSM 1799) TaxID=573729 RepID=G2QEL6_THET4|nr:uncharacterized protein MYCTH_2059795 [Thermothelomyces thermophilus ATCC 42464]AEO57799.1 hypothetical protein MYCTH_2059795 [Thermothelomyces thermophilus ATCC 42464]
MTTAHRPTFDPARGKEALRGPAYHQRLLPAYTKLKFRQPGQGGEADRTTRDLRAELEAAEAAHYAKLKGAPVPGASDDSKADTSTSTNNKRPLPLTSRGDGGGGGGGDGTEPGEGEEDPEAKRRRILAETRDIDADDESGSDGSSDDDDDDDDDESSDDEDAELQRELERVRRERLQKREAEERARRAAEQEAREREIATGNPLLNVHKASDFTIKRRWDDDVVFKNQARGTEEKGKKTEFINDLLRSDFHRRFMNKYVK